MVLGQGDENIKEEVWQELIDEADIDKDGEINFNDFKTIMEECWIIYYKNNESDGTIIDNSNQESIIIHTFLSNKNSSSQNSGSSIDNKRYFQTQTTKTSTKTGEVSTNKKHSSPSQNNKKIFFSYLY